jgi:hypothetical protein
MDVSRSIPASLDAGSPCRHDEVCVFIPVGERKIMNHSFEIKTKAIRKRELCSNQPRVKRPGLIDVRS